ncbi:hypothetical protein M5K25_011863 [Dendrobium thyrsiflorum]|uniref:Uncharacterized protein n=1 Tax=Dendrobium thyrsiflorum TaxID=117978 RepID=A0ABD0V4Q5_DENTH
MEGKGFIEVWGRRRRCRGGGGGCGGRRGGERMRIQCEALQSWLQCRWGGAWLIPQVGGLIWQRGGSMCSTVDAFLVCEKQEELSWHLLWKLSLPCSPAASALFQPHIHTYTYSTSVNNNLK